MDARIVFLLFALAGIGVTERYGEGFEYTIKNSKQEPFFNESAYLTIRPGWFLIDYMENACKEYPTRFKHFTVTYFPVVKKGAGYFVDAINSVDGYWKIFNNNVPLGLGVSLYVPKRDDKILFDLQ